MTFFLSRLRAAVPRRSIKCIVFVATATVVGLMLAQGIQVRRHPLEREKFVAPSAQISDSQFRELINLKDFVYLATLQFLVSPTGSNQTFTSPATWNSANNKIEVIAGGGGGGGSGSSDANGPSAGGGGGGYSKTLNFTFANPGTTTATYQIGSLGAGGLTSGNNGQDGTPGGNAWFNGATLAASTVGANGGGTLNNGGGAVTMAGGLGGSTTGATGPTKFAGGAGGLQANGTLRCGPGGGAAGPSGPGGAGGAVVSTTGGTADNGTVAGGVLDGNGQSGTEFDGSHGSGSGGGSESGGGTGGAGGNYGGGGAGSGGGVGAVGAQGLIVLTWIPAPAVYFSNEDSISVILAANRTAVVPYH